MEWLKGYWVALWCVLATALILRHRLRQRGGDDPMMRRIVYVSRPLADPRSPRYDAALPRRMLGFVVGGLVLMLIALWWVGRLG